MGRGKYGLHKGLSFSFISLPQQVEGEKEERGLRGREEGEKRWQKRKEQCDFLRVTLVSQSVSDL